MEKKKGMLYHEIFSPFSKETFLMRSYILISQKNYDEALSDLEEILKDDEASYEGF